MGQNILLVFQNLALGKREILRGKGNQRGMESLGSLSLSRGPQDGNEDL